VYIDRELSLSDAEQRADRLIKSLNLIPQIRSIGNKGAFISECTLLSPTAHEILAKGQGKSFAENDSKIFAKFEALEDYTSLITQKKDAKFHVLSLREIVHNRIPVIFDKIPAELINENSELFSAKLAWVEFQNLNHNKLTYVPAFHTSPLYAYSPFPADNFDYSQIYHTETSNGVAIGCSYEESMLHAILEILERDAVSLFLINTFLTQSPQKIHLMDQKTLPQNMQQQIEVITQNNPIKLYIIELPNDFNIPTYCVSIHVVDKSYAFRGYSASFNAATAVKSALLEAIESYNNPAETANIILTFKLLENWPHFVKCVLFDIPELLEKNQYQIVAFKNTVANFPTDVQTSLAELTEILNAAKFDIYFNTVFSEEGINTVQVIIPQAEDFCVIEKGIIVPPKDRGRAALEFNKI